MDQDIVFEMRDPLKYCKVCNEKLDDDGKERKRKRPRMCESCTKNSLAKRRKIPIYRLKARWVTSCHRRRPLIDSNLVTLETIQHVFERWGGKSVISGDKDIEHLCITCYKPFNNSREITLNDLIIVTSQEAQKLSRIKNADLYQAKIPDEIRAQIANN